MKKIFWLILAIFLAVVLALAFAFLPQKTEAVSIGYVGCSNTWQSIEGYHTVGGNDFWEADPTYGGGNVPTWEAGIEQENKYWRAFDAHLAEHPETDTIWWELCIRKEQVVTDEMAINVLKSIRERIPGVTIYVSSIPGYSDGVCFLSGTEGIERANEIIELLVTEHDVERGPILSEMTPEMTLPDGCHITDSGREIIGRDLKEFFENR